LGARTGGFRGFAAACATGACGCSVIAAAGTGAEPGRCSASTFDVRAASWSTMVFNWSCWSAIDLLSAPMSSSSFCWVASRSGNVSVSPAAVLSLAAVLPSDGTSGAIWGQA
jgi:hypothetical protein